MPVTDPVVSSWPSVPGRPNEDTAVASAATAVVVDGAGLPEAVRQGCRHTVQWYSNHLAQAMHDLLGDHALSMREALRSAIRETTAAHGPGCTLEGGSPSATLAAYRMAGPDLEYVVLGDASVLLARTDGAEEITDERLDQLATPRRQRLLAEWDRSGEFTGDDAWLEAHRRTTEVLRNVQGGFWVCQDDPAAADEALVGRVPLADLRGVVLATDGAVRGSHLLGIHDTETLVQRLIGDERADVFAEIRAAEAASRDDLVSSRIKVHDDVTVVSFRVTKP